MRLTRDNKLGLSTQRNCQIKKQTVEQNEKKGQIHFIDRVQVGNLAEGIYKVGGLTDMFAEALVHKIINVRQ